MTKAPGDLTKMNSHNLGAPARLQGLEDSLNCVMIPSGCSEPFQLQAQGDTKTKGDVFCCPETQGASKWHHIHYLSSRECPIQKSGASQSLGNQGVFQTLNLNVSQKYISSLIPNTATESTGLKDKSRVSESRPEVPGRRRGSRTQGGV